MTAIVSEVEAANAKYAAQFTKGHLPLPPGRLPEEDADAIDFNSKFLVLACMDARLDPARVLGLEEGDAHVVRNAGGRASDAVRSVVISQQLLGTREIIIIHHTDCGMLTFSDATIREKIRAELNQDADSIAFLPFGDVGKSVLDDIALLKANPLVLDVPITGYVYDVKTGKIEQVRG
ncbi:carbonic anhydrase [Geosmithia morbida]|uniref:Carbonic anhydrase n=1 Tax=Geosmithia morbida TaxID=1094350 RepID=A0A9P4Z2F1_9HYPO|nr:carbonic anhydrase [Geosmithia morbida]KAF4126013.1 carbonic anhydrase [Geosmithia morbida]